MLGWHRNDFNEQIASITGVNKNINWFDFEFNGSEDKELLNFDFIPAINEKWKERWVCGINGINWDAVGLSSDGTYILVEAKAHIKELESSAGGSSSSKEKNNKAIHHVLEKYNINKEPEDWNNNCYQLANRIVALDFLLEEGIKAKLVYVLFENGYELNASTNKSASKEEWLEAINKEFEVAGIKDTVLEKMVNICIINCKRDK